jgi:hypothetical protein
MNIIEAIDDPHLLGTRLNEEKRRALPKERRKTKQNV